MDRRLYEEINIWQRRARDTAAAIAALSVPLPQDRASRVSLNASRVAHRTGYGIGVAYMLDNSRNTAATLAVARAGQETVLAGSVSFEFGAPRRIRPPTIVYAAAADNHITENELANIEAEHEEEISALRSEKQELARRIEELEDQPVPEQRVERTIVQQEYLDDQKKDQLRGLIKE